MTDVPTTVRLSNDGRAVILDGPIVAGTSARFRSVVAAAPNAQTVFLHSPGGLLGEAEAISEVVRARRLATYVETICSSACTMILLSGTDRAVAPAARIGFHQPAFPAAAAAHSAALNRLARGFYDRAGVVPTFTDRVFSTPNSSMWYPRYEELVAARVVSRQTLGGETSAVFSMISSREQLVEVVRNHPLWQALWRRFPAVAEQAVDAGWQARGEGRNDGDVTSAMRALMMARMPEIMAGASDTVLDGYLTLIRDQVLAARAVSFEACGLLARGRLNVMLVLPPELSEREMALTIEAINSPAGAPPIADESADAILLPLFETMPAEQLAAMAAVVQPGAEPSAADLCEGSVELYSRVAALPPRERRLLTRYFLLSR